MTEAQADSGTVDGGASADRDWEAEARKEGWVPEEEFKGTKRPARFKTAQEYVEDGEKVTPHVERLLKKQRDEIEADFNTRLGKMAKVNDATVSRLTKIHEGEIADLRAQRKEAARAGDAELVERISTEIDKRQDEAPLTDARKPDRGDAEQAFADANPWYGPNRKMTNFAKGFSQDISQAAIKAGTPISFEDNIKQVLQAVREEFPEYYEKKDPGPNGHASVDGGGENGGALRSDPFSKLTAAERTQAEADMKKFPKVYPNKQAWITAYTS